MRVLDRFVMKYQAGAGDIDREAAHSLRGACAAVGATQLQAALVHYESILAAGTDVSELRQQADSINAGLLALTAALRPVLALAAPGPQAASSPNIPDRWQDHGQGARR
jgi:chemotaxis protein histidine kinase CheA